VRLEAYLAHRLKRARADVQRDIRDRNPASP